MIVVDQPGMHPAIHIAQCIGMLRIEVRTGMKHSKGSVLRLVQDRYGVKGRTKAAALDEMLALYEQVTGRPYGSR